jgi:hypothetical protein
MLPLHNNGYRLLRRALLFDMFDSGNQISLQRRCQLIVKPMLLIHPKLASVKQHFYKRVQNA